MAKGYFFEVLYVDLTAGKKHTEQFNEETYRKYIGGSGLGARLLFDGTSKNTDALGPENLLIFAVGPLTGTRVFNSNRFEVISKSPLTGIYGEANCGGYWGESFKRCGYDALVVSGNAKSPTYICIDEDGVQLEDASEIWGMDTFYTDRFFKQRYGANSQAAVIGPAGENIVLFASIMTDGLHGRAIGRCGLGAVMGSKNLKGVVVRGSKTVEVADPKGISAIQKDMAALMNGDLPKTIRELGTTGGVEFCEEIGNLPIRNWFQGSWPEGAEKISGQRMADTILVNNYGCGRCALRCGRVVRASGGDYDRQEIGGPEYETVGMLGSNCLVDDITKIAKANELCNRYGMDTISTGGVIGFAMEAYDRQLITKKDLGGLALEWGNGDAMIDMISQIALRKGWGNELANGVRRTAEKIGGLSSEFAIHVKGLEPPAHDPRAKMSSALQLATSNRGACHLQAFTSDFDEGLYIPDLGVPQMKDRFATEGKAENVIRMQHLMSMFDSLTCCKFLLFAETKVNHLLNLLNCVTGWDVGYEEFFQTGERIFNLKRLYNTRLGISRKDDNLPLRLLTHRRGGGTEALPPLYQMLSEYYEIRQWDELGIPTDTKIEELGL